MRNTKYKLLHSAVVTLGSGFSFSDRDLRLEPSVSESDSELESNVIIFSKAALSTGGRSLTADDLLPMKLVYSFLNKH